VALRHPSGAHATVFLFGADVTSYVDASGTEWLAVRPDSKMDGSKPISGGLSHCFPQFGPGSIQQHGFARNLNWAVHSLSESFATFELPRAGLGAFHVGQSAVFCFARGFRLYVWQWNLEVRGLFPFF
jgi:D-hexose-6-phosphate mutarotase